MSFISSMFGSGAKKINIRCWGCKKIFKGVPMEEDTCPNCLNKIKRGASFTIQ